MQAARDRQKSYAELKRTPMEFQVGNKIMLKVSPCKGVVHFGKRGKLNPRYVGPFKVLEKVGYVAYKIELPQELSRVHNTFHVSNLKKCYSDKPLAVPLEGLHVDDKLHFMEEPVEIMDREVKRLKQSRIPIVKVRWNSRRGPEFTWEREDQFQKKYPHLFTKLTPDFAEENEEDSDTDGDTGDEDIYDDNEGIHKDTVVDEDNEIEEVAETISEKESSPVHVKDASLEEGFDTFVETIWKEAHIIDSNAMAKLMKKLKYLKEKIQMWIKVKKDNSSKNYKKNLKKELTEIDLIIDKGEGNLEVLKKRA
ncbi:hypothetical protein Tco_0991823 [Tanacetum coccineum]|uniref:Tf2-1-like SH3-like domain-containing protein n=1 Tax=Tanacetum coccineum TaxID=301880 RepID=A0ABQ5F142_9ASTR